MPARVTLGFTSWATIHAEVERRMILNARDADPTLADADGKTPLDLCHDEQGRIAGPGHVEVAALLRAAPGAPGRPSGSAGRSHDT